LREASSLYAGHETGHVLHGFAGMVLFIGMLLNEPSDKFGNQ
jgi:hypothetical protein